MALPAVLEAKKKALNEQYAPEINALMPKAESTETVGKPNSIDEKSFAVELNDNQPQDNISSGIDIANDDFSKLPVRTLEEAEKEADLNKRRWSALQGINQKLTNEKEVIQNELASLRKKLQEVEEEKASRSLEAALELTPEEQDQYGDNIPFLKKFVSTAVKQATTPLLRKIEELESNGSSVTKSLVEAQEQTFYEAVRSSVPNFDAIVDSAEWKKYISKPMPMIGKFDDGTPATVAAALKKAHERRDFETVKSIFANFKKPDSLSDLVMPGSTASPLTLKDKPRLAWSKRKKASEDFRKGLISHDDLQKIKGMYDQADREGRVDYES